MTKRLGLMFAGQGAQAVGMGQDLAKSCAAAGELFRMADAYLGRELSSVCFNGPAEELTSSSVCQPGIYTMSLACLAALRERTPVAPVVCGGLSLGEFSALTASGALAFEDGIRLVAERGRLMGEACRATEGAMAAVLNADPATVESICADNGIDVANYNCPGQIVISGEAGLVDQTIVGLGKAGITKVIKLQVDGAFHSRQMSGAAEAFAPLLDATRFRAPSCAVVQNVVGGPVSDVSEIPGNLKKQVAGSVRWEQCVGAMLAMELDALIELGPGKVLSGFIRRIDRTFPVYNVGTAADVGSVAEALAS